MKRLIFLFIFISFLVFQNSFSQPWLKNLPNKPKGDLTLFDYQQAFEKYKKAYLAKYGEKGIKGEWEDAGLIPGEAQFRRWEWYWESRVDPITGEFPEKTAWEVWQEYKKTNNVKSIGGNWINLGPENINQDDRGTGRINCAAFDPNDNNHFWVGAPSGGVWETTDGGSTWTCLTDDNPVIGVSDIAIPSDYNSSTNPVIYIATGDRDAGDDPSIGVLKSTDNGQTWKRTGLQFPAKSDVRIGRLIIDPNNSSILWAATSVGIYKSTDEGQNWTFKQGGNFIDMELIPNSTNGGNPGILIATTYGWNPKVYKSTDGGENWNIVFDFASVSGNQYRCDVAVTPANTNVIYIITADPDNNMAFYGLYRSDDQGNTWTQVYSQSDNNLYGWKEINSASDGGQGWYDVALAVSNTDEDVVYVGGVNGYISTDGGQNFTLCNQWYSGVSTADVVHADHHNAYFRPSDNRLFDCNDGGFNYSDNVTAGKSSDWTNLTEGLINGQIYDIGVGQQSAKEIVAGFQDNGTKLLDNSATNSWLDVKGGDGMCCAIDPTDDNVQWGTYVRLQISYTTNKWSSSSDIRSSGGAAWAGPLEADPRGNNTIYIGTDRVEKYVGSSNTDLTGTSLDADYLRALDVYNDGTNLVIWTAGPNGCWKSDNNGQNYTKISGLPPDMVTDIAIDEDDYNHVYVCFGGYDNYNVYETQDGGQTWIDISDGLPPVPCGAIVINEQNKIKHEVYVGTDAGIYVKLGDAPWQLFNDGMPFVSITDLEFYYDWSDLSNTRLRAATYGRGVWETDTYEPPNLDATISSIEIPEEEYCSATSITPTIVLANIGNTTLTSATVGYVLDGNTVTQSWSGSLDQGQSTTITFSSINLDYGHHTFKAFVSSPNGASTDDNPDNDTLYKDVDVWNTSLPYTQTFDDFTLNVGYNGTAVPLEECWENDASESSLDWSVNQGQTASANTGPDGDHTSGAGKYLYTEVSGISSATPVNVLSPVFDLSNFESAEISFWYNMNGANCGSLQIDLYYNGAWHNAISANWDGNSATSISGNQGTDWHEVSADISAAVGYSDVRVRIASTTGTNYDGDIAIDDFNITGVVACTQPTPQASNISFSNITNNSFTVSWTRGGGDAELVLVKEGSAVDSDPVSGNTYNADSQFGQGDEIGTGNFVVYDGSAGTVTITGLNQSTTYYVAIYTYNAADHCYNVTELTGNVTTYGPPTVTTANVTNITGESAQCGGNVISDNGATVTARGVCWNTSGSPTISDSHTSDGSGTGSFTSQMTNLTPLTTYYVRAYATNSYGTAYGDEKTFTTACGTIRDYPFTEGFEGSQFPPECWAVFDNGVGTTYSWVQSSSSPHSGTYHAFIRYENVSNSEGTAEDWLVTPLLKLGFNSQLSYWEKQTYSTDYSSIYYIKISTGSQTDPNDFVDLISYGEGDFGTSYSQRVVDLSAYDDQYVYIAFVMVNDDGDNWYLDDINVNSDVIYEWNGSISDDWQTAGNWTPNKVPTSTDYARIPAGCPNYPNIDETGDVCYWLDIKDGGSLTVSAGGDLTVGTDMIVGEGTSGEVRVEGGSITVSGTVTFKANSYLGINGGNINFGSISLDGSSTTEYYANADQTMYNWTYGNLILSGSGNKYVSGDPTTPTQCQDLTINSGTVLYIDAGKSLTVNGTLTNNVGTNGLLINSSYDSGDGETYSGSLIFNTSNVGGTVISHLEGTQWHYISSPIDGAPRSMFNPTNFLYWDASTLWLGVDDNDYTPWHDYSSSNLVNGQGYAYYYYTTDLSYEGNLNVGNYTMTLRKYTGTGGEDQDQGWNLVGNPYTSPLNWDLVAAQSSIQNGDIEGAVYLFDDDAQTGDQGNYRYYVPSSPGTGGTYGVGTGDATKYIPVGQGFFVRSVNDNTTFEFSPSYREHGDAKFYKKAKDTTYQYFDLLRLFIENNENGKYDELVVRSLPNGHLDFDGLLDARKMYLSDETHPMLYALDSEGSNAMAINTLPQVKNHIALNLGFWTSDGSYTVDMEENLYDEQTGIYLEDTQTGIVTDLRTDSYTFTSNRGIHNNRFILHLVKNTPPYIWQNIENLTATEDQSFDFDLGEIFKDTTLFDKLTYNLSGADWIQIENGHLKGLPTNSDVGNYNLHIVATDKFGLNAEYDLELTVENVNDAPELNGEIPDQSVIAGEIWEYVHPADLFIDVDEGDELTYSAKLENDDLPVWIVYNADNYKFEGHPTLDDIGVYEIELIATDLSGASDTTSFVLTVTTPTILQNSEKLVIYPNPTKGELYIYNLLKYNAQTVELIDNSGKVLETRSIKNNLETIDMSIYPSGIYTLKITTNETVVSFKVIKE